MEVVFDMILRPSVHHSTPTALLIGPYICCTLLRDWLVYSHERTCQTRQLQPHTFQFSIVIPSFKFCSILTFDM